MERASGVYKKETTTAGLTTVGGREEESAEACSIEEARGSLVPRNDTPSSASHWAALLRRRPPGLAQEIMPHGTAAVAPGTRPWTDGLRLTKKCRPPEQNLRKPTLHVS